MIATAGMNPQDFLDCTDRATRLVMLSVAERAQKLRAVEGESQANRIANSVGTMLGGGK